MSHEEGSVPEHRREPQREREGDKVVVVLVLVEGVRHTFSQNSRQAAGFKVRCYQTSLVTAFIIWH